MLKSIILIGALVCYGAIKWVESRKMKLDRMKLAKFLCILGVVGMTTVCILLRFVYGITWTYIILLLAWCILYPASVLEREKKEKIMK